MLADTIHASPNTARVMGGLFGQAAKLLAGQGRDEIGPMLTPLQSLLYARRA